MLTYGNVKLDPANPAQVHPKSIETMLQRAFAHELGNVVAAKLVFKIKSAIAANNRIPVDDVGKNLIQSWRSSNAEQITTWTNEFVADQLKAIAEGTLGTRRASGPRVDPVDRKYRELVTKKVKTWLTNNGYAYPKTDDEVVTFSNGKTRTRVQLFEQVEKSQGEAIRREAKRQIDTEARLTKAERAEQADPDEIG